MTWQPIETAPRDGTKVLAYHKRNMTTIAYYGRVGDYNPVMWVSQGGTPHIDQPTHWMPLPAPPQGDVA